MNMSSSTSKCPTAIAFDDRRDEVMIWVSFGIAIHSLTKRETCLFSNEYLCINECFHFFRASYYFHD